MAVVVGFAVLLTGAAYGFTSCVPSAGRLERAVRGDPGVVSVEVIVATGERLPFAPVPKDVTVRMSANASRTEVMDVFDSYDRAVATGHVSVGVVLEGPKTATLAGGQDIHVSPSLVEELVAAQRDDTITRYRREAFPVAQSVEVTLRDADLAAIVHRADRYSDTQALDQITVLSGDSLLIRDSQNEDLRVTAARERLALEVAQKFRLSAAVISGRGPLQLAVTPEDRPGVLELVSRADSYLVGDVIVRARQPGTPLSW